MTASNSGGSTTFPIAITVNDVAPSISYGDSSVVDHLGLTVGVPFQKLTPSNIGGAVVTWSVGPALPPGLTLDTADGSISGTPTLDTAPAQYVITAENSGGRSSVGLTFVVGSVLLELGHNGSITDVQFSGSRVLSEGDANWVLWDYVTGSSIATGRFAPWTLAGSILVSDIVPSPGYLGFEVRASSDGHILSRFTSFAGGRSYWYKLPADGSYICAWSNQGVWAWSPSGNVLLYRIGDYSSSAIFAAPGELRVAAGPAGQNVVETISLATGASSVSPPFQGQFHSWFLDGERFLTYYATAPLWTPNAPATVWTYSKTGIQQDMTVLPSIGQLTGQGTWFWNHIGNSLDIYAVGASTQPTTTYTTSAATVPSGMTIGVMESPLGVIDLSGASPSRIDHALPSCGGCNTDNYPDHYAALSGSQWLISQRSVVLDGASLSGVPRYFGVGRTNAIAGGGGRVAVALDSGRILIVNVLTKAVEGSISAFSNEMQMSPDGATLYAAMDPAFSTDRSIKVYSLPSAAEINSVPYGSGVFTALGGMELASSSLTFGKVLRDSGNGYMHEVASSLGGQLIWSVAGVVLDRYNNGLSLALSPAGTLIAATDGNVAEHAVTAIMRNGISVVNVPGVAAGWIDNSRLLVNNFVAASNGRADCVGYTVYDPTGTRLFSLGSASSRPECLRGFQTVNADSLYEPGGNFMISLTTGARTWTSRAEVQAPWGIGVVVGSHVVFGSYGYVYSEPY